MEACERPEKFRGTHRAYTWLTETRKQLDLRVTGGLIKHYRDRGNVRLWLHADKEATLEPVDEDRTVPPDGKERAVSLESPYDGLHRLQWADGRDMTRIELPENVPFAFRSTLQDRADFWGRWSLYFYVPKGTKVVGGYATETSGRVRTAAGETVFVFGRMEQADYFSIPAPEGQDGTLWKFEDCTGARMLLTVPPYLAASANDLLLPQEVVDAGAK